MDSGSYNNINDIQNTQDLDDTNNIKQDTNDKMFQNIDLSKEINGMNVNLNKLTIVLKYIVYILIFIIFILMMVKLAVIWNTSKDTTGEMGSSYIKKVEQKFNDLKDSAVSKLQKINIKSMKKIKHKFNDLKHNAISKLQEIKIKNDNNIQKVFNKFHNKFHNIFSFNSLKNKAIGFDESNFHNIKRQLKSIIEYN